ncbi:MAG: hypothetical protein LBU34_10185 [Planctomycetaceae bacterium]|nr:hypothetical protein [Planctomycetaceae bacterium]
MVTLSNEHLPWLIVIVMSILLLLPKSNGGKTDFLSRLLGLFGIKVKKEIEDMERESGLIGSDGFDTDLYKYRIRRLDQKLNREQNDV